MRFVSTPIPAPAPASARLNPALRMSTSSIFHNRRKTEARGFAMRMFWEFFTFELRFRRNSISTYVYFLLWFFFSFLCVASESFGPVGAGNGKILLNGPWAATLNYIYISLFGVIVIAAIFGTSILRDFQRDTYQMLFTKPISKF